MKRITKRAFAILLSAALVLGMTSVSFAGNDPANSEKEPSGLHAQDVEYICWLTDVIWEDSGTWLVGVDAWNEDTEEYLEMKVTAVTTSNKDILSVEEEDYDGVKDFYVVPVSAGTADVYISFDGKYGSGSLTKEVTVKPYPNQIKSLKVNGKKVNTDKNRYYYEKKYKGTKAKVKVALKSGWKITDAWCYMYKKDWKGEKRVNVTAKKLKNGSAIKFPKKYKHLNMGFTMENEAGEFIHYSMYIYR